MGAFLSYSLTSGLILLAMYLAYRLFMAADNQHAYNRGVILGIYAVSFLSLPAAHLIGNMFSRAGDTAMPATAGFIAKISVAAGSQPLWSTIILWVFIAGMVITGVRSAIVMTRIIRVIAHGEKTDLGRYTLVLTDDNRTAPFSWARYMVMSRDDYAACGDTITAHELRHITCRHWLDLLLSQAVAIINWFNPAAWLMRDELMLVHEYQADMAVIDSGHNPKEYQLLLIKKAVGARFPSLANSLNHSKLKKRITMMYKSKSNAGARFKVLALAPAVAVALCVAAVPGVKAAISTISHSEAITGKDSEKSAETEITAANFKVKNLNNNDGETTLVVAGTGLGNCLSVEDATLTNAGKTYRSKGVSCSLTKGEATITYTFPFIDEFENMSLDLEVNGSKVNINMEPFLDNSTDVIVVANGDEKSDEKADISAMYIDGKPATEAEMKAVNPSDIESMQVSRNQNGLTVEITLRK